MLSREEVCVCVCVCVGGGHSVTVYLSQVSALSQVNYNLQYSLSDGGRAS